MGARRSAMRLGVLIAVAGSALLASPLAGQTRLGPVAFSSGAMSLSGPGGSATVSLGQPAIGAAGGESRALWLGFWPGTLDGVPTPVRFLWFHALWTPRGAELSWRALDDAGDLVGFQVHRQLGEGPRVQLTETPLRGAEEYRFTDPAPPAGRVAYWLEEWGRAGDRTWHGPAYLQVPGPVAPVLALLPGVPNPARGHSRIRFQVPAPGRVRLRAFDQRGRLVGMLLDEDLPAGAYESTWTGRDDRGNPVAAGVYFIYLETESGNRARKLTVLP